MRVGLLGKIVSNVPAIGALLHPMSENETAAIKKGKHLMTGA